MTIKMKNTGLCRWMPRGETRRRVFRVVGGSLALLMVLSSLAAALAQEAPKDEEPPAVVLDFSGITIDLKRDSST